MGAEPKGIGRIWKGALGLLYPPQCLACGAPVDAEGALCGPCWREAQFLGLGACCDGCGVPLPGAAAEGLACDDCLAAPKPWGRARAALAYTGAGRLLALALKHGDRPDLAVPLGGWVAQAAGPLVAEGTVVVPVPIHPLRLLKRRYNQAALLAAEVARAHRLEWQPLALKRLRHTPMQDHRSVADRVANQAEALAASTKARLAGRAVLLVDDVMASGATAAAAAEALMAAGAARVDVAVLARAVKD